MIKPYQIIKIGHSSMISISNISIIILNDKAILYNILRNIKLTIVLGNWSLWTPVKRIAKNKTKTEITSVENATEYWKF